PATPDTHPLSLHDALPIFTHSPVPRHQQPPWERGPYLLLQNVLAGTGGQMAPKGLKWTQIKSGLDPCPLCFSRTPLARGASDLRSEEHTSELQSLAYLVCR